MTADDVEAREENKKTCLCTGPSCICCVDFNMSLIDLGGPGMYNKYLVISRNSLISNLLLNRLRSTEVPRGRGDRPERVLR